MTAKELLTLGNESGYIGYRRLPIKYVCQRKSTWFGSSVACMQASPIELPSPKGEEDEQELAALCKALAHPARIRILKILSERKSGATRFCGVKQKKMSLR